MPACFFIVLKTGQNRYIVFVARPNFMQTSLVQNGGLEWFTGQGTRVGDPEESPTNAKEAYFKIRLDLMNAYMLVGFDSRDELKLLRDHHGQTAFRLAGRFTVYSNKR